MVATDEVEVCLLGRRFCVRGDAAVVGEVRRLLDFFAVRPAPPGGRPDRPVVSVRRSSAGYPVTTTGDLAAAGVPAAVRAAAAGGVATDVPGAVLRVLAIVNAAALAGPDCFAVHAGVVSRGGLAVAFPAGSGQGKSTLAAACLRAGWDYVSDEALCLDWRDGRVLPYPRPLDLSGWSRAAVGLPTGPVEGSATGSPVGSAAGPLTAADLGAAVARPPLTLRHLVLPVRHPDPEVGEVTLEPAPAQPAAAALLTRSFNHWRDPDRAFELAHEVAARTRVWRLRWGDPTGAAAVLTDLLD